MKSEILCEKGRPSRVGAPFSSFLVFFLFLKDFLFLPDYLRGKDARVEFYLRSTREMILQKYCRATVYPVPRGRIKLTFIHRREIPGYHNSEVRGASARESIVLYAESAGRHADFISSLYHPYLDDEARKETLVRGEGRRENCEGRQRRKVSWKIPVPLPSRLETRNSTKGLEKTERQRGKRERSFPLAFSRRKSRLVVVVVVSSTVAAKGKNPGRSEEATRR